MAKVTQVPVVPTPLAKNWSEQSPAKPITPLATGHTLLPAGPAYLAHARRTIHNRSIEEDDKLIEEERARIAGLNGDATTTDDLGVGDEDEDAQLLSLDPKEWKKQDHYAVLGLSKLRYKATEDQIRIAHRKKVLKHHPDKKAGLAGDANDDSFFKCIQKALEVLTHPEKHRQFDSVDPYFQSLEDENPTASDFGKNGISSPDKFFEEFTPVYEREARFSRKQPVPLLGSPDASKAEVEGFYDFWYNFDSWRSFEYLDKEVNEGSDSRDDKRYTEKKNKTERARRKKEDIARLRTLVDLTLSLDPRIKRIKQEEKEAREKAKQKGKGGKPGEDAKKKAEEDAKKAEEDAKKAAEAEEAAKADAKKAKAAAANAAKKARRAARQVEEGGA